MPVPLRRNAFVTVSLYMLNGPIGIVSRTRQYVHRTPLPAAYTVCMSRLAHEERQMMAKNLGNIR